MERNRTSAVARSRDLAFQFAPDAMLVLDVEGNVLRANRRVTELLGIAEHDLRDGTVDRLLHAAGDDDCAARLVTPPARPGERIACTARRADDSEVPVEITRRSPPGTSEVVLVVRDVTDDVRTAQRRRATIDFAPDATVIVDEAGVITFANRQVSAVFGWPPEELVGQKVDELVPLSARTHHGELRAQFFDRPRVREMGAGLQLMGRRRDGTEFPVEISLSPLPGEPKEVMASVRDVSRRRAAEERARAMLEFAPDATIIVDRAGRIVQANRQVTALFGHDASTLDGMVVEQLLPERHRWTHVVHRDSFGASPRMREMGAGDELFGLHADGSEFAVEVSLSPLPGPEDQVIATIRDVSERRAAREALEAALDHEREAARELRATTRLKDEFLDIAAHELRTPLASVVGFASALADEWDERDEDFKLDLVRRILRNGSSMAELTERLLDVSRLEAGRIKPRHELLDVEDLLHELVDELEPLADRDVHTELDVDGPVRTDRRALSHVVTNLLTNAAKYSDAPAPITLTAHLRDGGVEIAVTDEGIGIPAEDVPHLFEHFFRGANHNRGRGTGVGLSVANQYVELLGGVIRVDSTRGKGSTFTVWIPDEPDDGESDTSTDAVDDSARGPVDTAPTTGDDDGSTAREGLDG